MVGALTTGGLVEPSTFCMVVSKNAADEATSCSQSSGAVSDGLDLHGDQLSGVLVSGQTSLDSLDQSGLSGG